MKYELYPKRDPIKNYFALPNEIFTLGLKPGEISVYAFLLRCEDRKTYKCYPRFKTIAKALNISKNTVRKYVENHGERKKLFVMMLIIIYTIKKRKETFTGSRIYLSS